MTRLLGVVAAVYMPHLTEEALTKMYDDPIIVALLAPFAELAPRHAAYLMFQAMLAVTLGAAFAFGLGGKPRIAVVAAFGVALLAEAHHLVRACVALHYNSGLLTSLPMPILGLYVLRRVTLAWPLSPRLEG